MKWHDIRKGEQPAKDERVFVWGLLDDGCFRLTHGSSVLKPMWTKNNKQPMQDARIFSLWATRDEVEKELDSDD